MKVVSINEAKRMARMLGGELELDKTPEPPSPEPASAPASASPDTTADRLAAAIEAQTRIIERALTRVAAPVVTPAVTPVAPPAVVAPTVRPPANVPSLMEMAMARQPKGPIDLRIERDGTSIRRMVSQGGRLIIEPSKRDPATGRIIEFTMLREGVATHAIRINVSGELATGVSITPITH